MLKKIFSFNDCESNKDALIKGTVLGLAIGGTVNMILDVTTLIVRNVVRDEIEKLK